MLEFLFPVTILVALLAESAGGGSEQYGAMATPGSSPVPVNLSDGTWGFIMFPDGHIKVTSGPSNVGTTYWPGDAKYAQVFKALYSGKNASKIDGLIGMTGGVPPTKPIEPAPVTRPGPVPVVRPGPRPPAAGDLSKETKAQAELQSWAGPSPKRLTGLAVFPNPEMRSRNGVVLAGLRIRWQGDGGSALKSLKNKVSQIARKNNTHAAVDSPVPAEGQPGWNETVIGFAERPGQFHPILSKWEKLGQSMQTLAGKAKRSGLLWPLPGAEPPRIKRKNRA